MRPLCDPYATKINTSTPFDINKIVSILVNKYRYMATKDYLHSELLSKPCNFKVFQETYEGIRRISWKMAEAQCNALGIQGKQREEYQDVFMNEIEDIMLNVVNYTIENFEK